MDTMWRDAATAAARRCNNAPRPCNRTATEHLLFPDGTTRLSCQAHSVSWGRQRYRDRHKLCGECGLPGTSWVPTVAGLPGRCVIEGLDLPDLFATEAELGRRIPA